MFDVGYQNQIFNFHYPSIFKSKSSLPVKLRKGAKWYVSTLPEWTWRIRRKRYKIWEVWYKIPLFKIQRNIDTNWINIKKLNSTWMNQSALYHSFFVFTIGQARSVPELISRAKKSSNERFAPSSHVWCRWRLSILISNYGFWKKWNKSTYDKRCKVMKSNPMSYVPFHSDLSSRILCG